MHLSAKRIAVYFSVLFAAAIVCFGFMAQQKNPWTEKQLMPPAELAEQLNKPEAEQPVIFSVGPSGLIKGATQIGSTNETENLDKLKAELEKLPKDRTVIIYCGCCPFDKCPNIRPAFSLLKEMKFENAKLLNLPKNLKADWIDKGYPMASE
jgi:hypothetical protein